ncbi:haloacid dehalogenase [Oxalicibacterium solurbis]|uniref:Haloacid dehalogenase n=1 Tax=Oxalicibacterium solurbis TaxID=69280 RepID=A0A8J3ATX5_9BURK|nr:haloacid dehalogenase [Oxalicibacterium solurbis]
MISPKYLSRSLFIHTLLLFAALCSLNAQAQTRDPLPSWNDNHARARIIAFVDAVTEQGGKDYVPPAERIAVFDNDGTLWSEQPIYFQAQFIIDRVKALAPRHPEWKTTQPFKGILEGDMKSVVASGEKGLLELVMATHSGSTTDEFRQIVLDWLATARHPKYKRPYNELIYQPMLELLAYLRANGFKTYIVSGGGVEFMRAWVEKAYGIPPEQVIGSTIKTKYELRNGKPVIVRIPQLDFNDDKAGKPVAINQYIGRRPIAAFGNSDGDFQMLEWVTSGNGPRLGMIVHHDDGEREYAYDRKSFIGKLARGLDEAPQRGWSLISMKQDWKQIYPQDK